MIWAFLFSVTITFTALIHKQNEAATSERRDSTNSTARNEQGSQQSYETGHSLVFRMKSATDHKACASRTTKGSSIPISCIARTIQNIH